MQTTYVDSMKQLARRCEFPVTIYATEPTREKSRFRPLTCIERQIVDQMSGPERGWRPFTADMMS
jgi:hypothetical protein